MIAEHIEYMIVQRVYTVHVSQNQKNRLIIYKETDQNKRIFPEIILWIVSFLVVVVVGSSAGTRGRHKAFGQHAEEELSRFGAEPENLEFHSCPSVGHSRITRQNMASSVFLIANAGVSREREIQQPLGGGITVGDQKPGGGRGRDMQEESEQDQEWEYYDVEFCHFWDFRVLNVEEN